MKHSLVSLKASFSYHDLLFFCVLFINLLLLYYMPIYKLLYPFFTYFGILFLVALIIGFQKLKVKYLEGLVASLILVTAFFNTFVNGLAIGEYFELIWFYGLYFVVCHIKNNFSIQRVILPLIAFFLFYLMIYSVLNREKFALVIESDVFNPNNQHILNPNQVGQGLTLLYWLFQYYLSCFKYPKIMQVGLFIGTVIGIYFSKSRACLLVFLMSVLIYFFVGSILKKNRIIAMLLLVCMITFGFIFPIIYVQLWHKLGFSAEFLGKPLFTGRERIWETLFGYMKKHPQTFIVGTGKVKEIFWHDKFNLHNSYIALYSMFGLFPFIGHTCFICYNVNKAFKVNGALSNGQLYLYILILVTMMFGIVETILTYILTMIFMVIAISFINSEKKHVYHGIDLKPVL